MNPTHIIWNGCDAYESVDNLSAPDYNIEPNDQGGYTLWTQTEHFHSIPCLPADPDTVPTDEDGEPDYTGLIVTHDFRVWRPA